MQVDLLSDDWEKQNNLASQALAKHFQFELPHLRIFQGLMPAVFETVFGLALFHSHKKSAVLCKGNTYAFQGVLPYLFKDGFQIQNLSANVKHDFQAIVEGLKKDTNFVLLAEDHPTTAELFDFEELEKKLNEQKIFCIRISHHLWRRNLQKLSPYSVRICSVDPQHAFVQLGEKFKAPTMTTQFIDWRAQNFASILENSVSSFAENKKMVEDFESSLPEGWQAWAFSQQRLYDRAVVFHPNLNAEAVVTALLGQNKFTQQDSLPGFPISIESINFARWKTMLKFEDWWEPLPTAEQIRGMIIVDQKLLQNNDLRKALAEVEKQCRI